MEVPTLVLEDKVVPGELEELEDKAEPEEALVNQEITVLLVLLEILELQVTLDQTETVQVVLEDLVVQADLVVLEDLAVEVPDTTSITVTM